MTITIVLASASKRRSEILKSCGIKHIIKKSRVREIILKNNNIANIVKINAKLKSEAVAKNIRNALIIGADTLVCCDGNIMGKPKNKAAAKKTLSEFSGKKIEVFTGICLIDTLNQKQAMGVDKSTIWVEKISPEEIKKYLDLLAPYDKAGGFSIEGTGSLLFDNLKGSYFNILGLPMILLKKLFRKLGFDIKDFIYKN